MTLAHLLLTEGGTPSDEVQTQTQWRPRKNIGCTRVCLVVTLSVVLHFSFISPSLCIVMWGPSEPGRTQAMVHGAPWSELCRVPGLAQSWQRREWRHSDVMDHMSREILTTQWDPVTRSEENRAESSDILTIRGSPHLKWEICSYPEICLQVVSLGVITVRRANIKNQHLLDLLLICEIVAWSCYNCGQIWRDSSWCGGTLCLIIHPAHTVERHGSQSGQVPVCSQARISPPVLGGIWQENWLSDSNFVKLRHLETGDWAGGMASWLSLLSLRVIRLKTVWRVTGNCENIPSVQSLAAFPATFLDLSLSQVWSRASVSRDTCPISWDVSGDGDCAGSGQATQNTQMCDPGAGARLRSTLQSLALVNNAPGTRGRHQGCVTLVLSYWVWSRVHSPMPRWIVVQ